MEDGQRRPYVATLTLAGMKPPLSLICRAKLRAQSSDQFLFKAQPAKRRQILP